MPRAKAGFRSTSRTRQATRHCWLSPHGCATSRPRNERDWKPNKDGLGRAAAGGAGDGLDRGGRGRLGPRSLSASGPLSGRRAVRQWPALICRLDRRFRLAAPVGTVATLARNGPDCRRWKIALPGRKCDPSGGRARRDERMRWCRLRRAAGDRPRGRAWLSREPAGRPVRRRSTRPRLRPSSPLRTSRCASMTSSPNMKSLGPDLRRGGPHDSWWTDFKREIGSLVEVHRASGPPSTRTRATIARCSILPPATSTRRWPKPCACRAPPMPAIGPTRRGATLPRIARSTKSNPRPCWRCDYDPR